MKTSQCVTGWRQQNIISRRRLNTHKNNANKSFKQQKLTDNIDINNFIVIYGDKRQ